VVCDPATRETLPVREWAAGFAEVVKTALLAGGRLWELVRTWEPGRGTPEQRLELIRRCAAYKARVVAFDGRGVPYTDAPATTALAATATIVLSRSTASQQISISPETGKVTPP